MRTVRRLKNRGVDRRVQMQSVAARGSSSSCGRCCATSTAIASSERSILIIVAELAPHDGAPVINGPTWCSGSRQACLADATDLRGASRSHCSVLNRCGLDWCYFQNVLSSWNHVLLSASYFGLKWRIRQYSKPKERLTDSPEQSGAEIKPRRRPGRGGSQLADRRGHCDMGVDGPRAGEGRPATTCSKRYQVNAKLMTGVSEPGRHDSLYRLPLIAGEEVTDEVGMACVATRGCSTRRRRAGTRRRGNSAPVPERDIGDGTEIEILETARLGAHSRGTNSAIRRFLLRWPALHPARPRGQAGPRWSMRY